MHPQTMHEFVCTHMPSPSPSYSGGPSPPRSAAHRGSPIPHLPLRTETQGLALPIHRTQVPRAGQQWPRPSRSTAPGHRPGPPFGQPYSFAGLQGPSALTNSSTTHRAPHPAIRPLAACHRRPRHGQAGLPRARRWVATLTSSALPQTPRTSAFSPLVQALSKRTPRLRTVFLFQSKRCVAS